MTDYVKLAEDVRQDRAAGMPDFGGWMWQGHPDGLSLATRNGGRYFVMGFKRKGMNGAQPCFQTGGVMLGAVDELATFSVGDDNVRGHAMAMSNQSVYRYDISGVDHPDARRIARTPEIESAFLALQEENARLREALEPFVDAADECDGWGYDDQTQASVSAGDCRLARTALTDKGRQDLHEATR